MKKSSLIRGFLVLVLLPSLAACGGTAVPTAAPDGVNPEAGDPKTIVSGIKPEGTHPPVVDESVPPTPLPTGSVTCTAESDAGFCTRLGKNCDLVTTLDNCGTTRTVSCGNCTAPLTCIANGCIVGTSGGTGSTGATPPAAAVVRQHPCIKNPELCKPAEVPRELVKRLPTASSPPPAPDAK